MEVTHVAVVRTPPGRRGWPRLVSISLAALVALAFFVGVALPYLTLDQEVLARYWSRRAWVLVHIAAGAVALLTGPVQLWLGVSRRAMRCTGGSVSSTSPASRSAPAQRSTWRRIPSLGWGFGAGITALGIAWLVTTTLAVAAIRRGLIEQHRDWMIRSYIVTFAFVTFRASWSALQAAGVGRPGTAGRMPVGSAGRCLFSSPRQCCKAGEFSASATGRAAGAGVRALES